MRHSLAAVVFNVLSIIRQGDLISHAEQVQVLKLLSDEKLIEGMDTGTRSFFLSFWVSQLQTEDSRQKVTQSLIRAYLQAKQWAQRDLLIKILLQQQSMFLSNFQRIVLAVSCDASGMSDGLQLAILREIHNALKTAGPASPLSALKAEDVEFMFLFCNNATRSLTPEIKLEACKILQLFPIFKEEMILQTIQKEKMEDFSALKQRSDEESQTAANLCLKRHKATSLLFYNHHVGSIIHLLEDESSKIRTEAVKAMEHLAQNARFAQSSREILMYMLNDENDGVRIQSLTCMKKIFKTIEITQQELEIIMFNIKEECIELRQAIYQCCASLTLRTEQDFLQLIAHIEANLRNFPSDTPHIYRMLQQISLNNKKIVQSAIMSILQIQEVFNVQEPKSADPVHVCRLVLIVNCFDAGFTQNELLAPQYPKYLSNHLELLRDERPDLCQQPAQKQMTLFSQEKYSYRQISLQMLQQLFSAAPHSPSLAPFLAKSNQWINSCCAQQAGADGAARPFFKLLFGTLISLAETYGRLQQNAVERLDLHQANRIARKIVKLGLMYQTAERSSPKSTQFKEVQQTLQFMLALVLPLQFRSAPDIQELKQAELCF